MLNSKMNACPECDKFIRADAFKCSCGWERPSQENRRVLIDCAYAGCMSPAICRVKKPQGWANLCLHHYTNDNLQESIDYCAKHGLDTVEKKIAHCKALFRKPRDPRAWMKNPKSALARRYADEVLKIAPVEREPGEDLEEIKVSI